MRFRRLTGWPLALGGGTLLTTMAFVTMSLVTPSWAADNGAPAAIRKALEERYPDVKIVDVTPGPLPGIYEVFMGDSIAYSDATGDHLFVGSVMDTKTKTDLTQERVDARNAIDFKSLPFARAIKVVKGNGKRQLAVFSDPDCPYCQRLEQQLAKVTDVTIYTFLLPITELHPDALPKSKAIWCASNRSETWLQWMTERKPPLPKADCKDDPIEELQALGRKLNVGSTPTLYLADGRRIVGARNAATLEALLNGSAPDAKKAAGAP